MLRKTMYMKAASSRPPRYVWDARNDGHLRRLGVYVGKVGEERGSRGDLRLSRWWINANNIRIGAHVKSFTHM